MSKKKLIILITSIVLVILICVIAGIVINNNLNNSKSANNAKSIKIDNKTNATIKIAENKKIEYETYDNGLVSMEIPKGWKVEVPQVDYIHYTFKAYNPEDTDYMFIFSLKLEGFLKSENARSTFARMYPDAMFSKLSPIEPQTTEAFYKVWNNNAKLANDLDFKYKYFPYLNDFTVIENLCKLNLGGDVLRATFKNDEDKLMQGLFTASVNSSGSYVMYGVDLAPLNVYHTIMMMAPDEEFVNYQEMFDHCLGTVKFSNTFMNGFSREETVLVSTIQANQKIYDEISDMIMDSWEKRSNSYDIISQKRSDATLGYERVYDTETGDVYKAYNGFTDDYTESRYQSITDDMYTSAISGYIEK